MKNRLCWVENSLKNYTHNFRGIKKFVGSSVKIMAIVKANAYGHGIEGISRWAQELGADFFGVVCLKEARILREAGIEKPILILNIAQIRRIHKGETVGYGRTYTAKRDTLVGALAIGYADGFRRGPTNWGEVLIRERRAKILGRVSMDQSSIDITDAPHPSVGDEVVLIEKQGREEITAGEIAQKIGTINYEVLSSLSQRVDRKFWD